MERNWAALPLDVMALIFEKAGSMAVLLSAQAVCSSWWKLAHETRIWRIVRFTSPYELHVGWWELEKMAIDAIDRSQGQLVEFSVERLGRPDGVIKHLAQRTNILQHLRLKYCFTTVCERMIESFKCFPLLEELELSYNSFSRGVLEAVGKLCPKLNCLKLHRNGGYGYGIGQIVWDEDAMAIANSMPQLNYLGLFHNKLTNDGLLAILQGCPHIRSLDLRKCYNLKLEGGLLENYRERIKDLRLPEDPIDDYGYSYTESYDDYDDYIDHDDLVYEDLSF